MREFNWRTGTVCASLVGLLVLASLPSHADPKKDVDIVLETKGYLVPVHQVTVSPQAAGVVADLPIEEGQRVKKGEILARLDPGDYEANLQLAKAELALAEARFQKQKQGGDLAVGQAEIAVARARVHIAERRVQQTIIRAPFDGTVLVRKVSVGTLVDPAAFQGPSAICEMADLGTMEVELFIQERDVHRVAVGRPCNIMLEAFPKATYHGRIIRIMPVADRAKGALPVRVRLNNPDERVRPEMGAVVQILAKQEGL